MSILARAARGSWADGSKTTTGINVLLQMHWCPFPPFQQHLQRVIRISNSTATRHNGRSRMRNETTACSFSNSYTIQLDFRYPYSTQHDHSSFPTAIIDRFHSAGTFTGVPYFTASKAAFCGRNGHIDDLHGRAASRHLGCSSLWPQSMPPWSKATASGICGWFGLAPNTQKAFERDDKVCTVMTALPGRTSLSFT